MTALTYTQPTTEEAWEVGIQRLGDCARATASAYVIDVLPTLPYQADALALDAATQLLRGAHMATRGHLLDAATCMAIAAKVLRRLAWSYRSTYTFPVAETLEGIASRADSLSDIAYDLRYS